MTPLHWSSEWEIGSRRQCKPRCDLKLHANITFACPFLQILGLLMIFCMKMTSSTKCLCKGSSCWVLLLYFLFVSSKHFFKLLAAASCVKCPLLILVDVLFSSTGQSKQLRDLLCNPHLRHLLQSIDNADCKDDAMKAAMQEPLFIEFSDQCLQIVENEPGDV